MPDVFLSYRNTPERRAYVERLQLLLDAYGLTVWWDYGLEAGKGYETQIVTELQAAGLIMPLWCEESIHSVWVAREAKFGLDHEKLLPARLQAVRPPDPFEPIQAQDLVGWDGAVESFQITALAAAICAKLGKALSPAADKLRALRALSSLSPLSNSSGSQTKNGRPSSSTSSLVDGPSDRLPRTPPPRIGERWELDCVVKIPKAGGKDEAPIVRASWGHTILVVSGRAYSSKDRAYVYEFSQSGWKATEFIPNRRQKLTRPVSYWSFVESASPRDNIIVVGDQRRVFTWRWETIDTHHHFTDSVTVLTPDGAVTHHSVGPSGRKSLPFEDIGPHVFLDFGQWLSFAPDMESFVHRTEMVDKDAKWRVFYNLWHYGERDKISGWQIKVGPKKTSSIQFESEDGHGMIGGYSPISWSPSGLFLFVNEKGLVPLKSTNPSIRQEKGWYFIHGAWHPTKDVLALCAVTTGNRRVELIDVSGGDLLACNDMLHRDWIRSVNWSPDGRWIATCSADGTTGLWDLQEDKVYSLHGDGTPPERAQFSPCGQRLAVFDLAGKNIVSLYDVESRQELLRFPGACAGFTKNVWHKDGRMLGTLKDKYTVEVRRLAV